MSQYVRTFKIPFALVKKAALTNVLPLYARKHNEIIERVVVDLITPFTGTTTLVAEIGIAGTTAKYLAQKDMKAAALRYVSAPTPTGNNGGFDTAGVTVDALFTATVDNLSALTAGLAVVQVFCTRMPLPSVE